MVQLGLLWSTLVYFCPLWSDSVQFGSLGNFFSPGALFRPRAYKNRSAGQKNFPQWISRLESLQKQSIWGNFFSPRCSVFVGSRPKQSICGQKISPVDQIGLNGTNVDWSTPKWTEVDLIGPNNNSLILKEYKLYIILQVQNN